MNARNTMNTAHLPVVVIGAARSLRATVLPLWADHVGISAEATSLVRAIVGLDRAGVAVSGIESRRPSLDDVFLGLTGRSLREAGTAPAAAQEVATR